MAGGGVAEVCLASRKVKIKTQFVDDMRDQQDDHIAKLRRALLILHSPVDETVNIAEAEKIYLQALHPKSFISLDKADHLLSRAEDSEYVAACISAWARRYLPEASANEQQKSTPSEPAAKPDDRARAANNQNSVGGTDAESDPYQHLHAGLGSWASRFLPESDLLKRNAAQLGKGHVQVDERNKQFARDVQTDSHRWIADEPTAVGGQDLGPDPYEHLLAGLGACTSMTLRMYANRKKLALEDIQIELSHKRSHAQDCEDCESGSKFVDVIERNITLKGELTDAERKRLLEIADRCPVHLTLENDPKIVTREV